MPGPTGSSSSRKSSPSLLSGLFSAKRLSWALRAALLLILLWFGLWFAVGDSLSYFGYINAGGLVFGITAIIIAVILTMLRDWITAPLAAIVGFGLMLMPSGTNMAAGEERQFASDLRVMSASLRGLNRDMAGSARHLARYDADIIGLQEVHDAEAFRQALEEETGKPWNVVTQNNLALLSHHPVRAEALAINGVLKTRVMVDGRRFSVWTLRAPKAFETPTVNRLFYRDLAEAIANETPDAVIGDFNASRWNEGYAIMSDLMQNAQKSAGFGPGSTFPGPARRSGLFGAYVRIDHIFAARELRIANAFTGGAYIQSDHHPVIADFRLGTAGATQ
ncbi:MAG: endonuclease/exonuclease/phosphatase family protein [Pseudomonadota bacterium]